jgi:hypothetical protein
VTLLAKELTPLDKLLLRWQQKLDAFEEKAQPILKYYREKDSTAYGITCIALAFSVGYLHLSFILVLGLLVVMLKIGSIRKEKYEKEVLQKLKLKEVRVWERGNNRCEGCPLSA